MRSQLNRVIVVVAVVVLLPAIAAAELLQRAAGRRVARRGVQITARLCGVRFVVRGSEELDPAGSYVLVPNHASPLDIPALLVACPQARFLAAAELFRNPLLAIGMRAMGTVPIARRDPALARRQLADLARRSQPRFLVAFAEGGIAPLGRRLPFKSGPFRLATETGTAVVPVAIHGSGALLPPGSAFAVRPGTVVVTLLDPVVPCRAGGHRALRTEVERAVLDALEDHPPAGLERP